jgi:outer membrane protein assembly factor BamB
MTQRLKLTRRASIMLPLALPALLGGCNLFDWLTDEAGKPIPGNREPVISPARGLDIDAIDPVVLPDAVTNPSWAQMGGGPSHVGGNLAGGLRKVWSTEIGKGGAYRQRLTAEPIIAGSQIFTMDTDGNIDAIDLATGHHLWRTDTKPKKNRSSNLGGGLAFQNGRIYAATGRAELMMLDAGSGNIVWRVDIGAPARSAPTIVDGALYLVTIDQRLIAATVDGGKPLWTYDATNATTGMLPHSAPAVADGIVVAGFESGDLAAVHADTGLLAWSDNLGAMKGTASLVEFSTVRGSPVIDNGIVYAIGLGGLMAALDLRSGRRVWDREIAGANMPWLAGDTLFIVSTEQKVAAVSKLEGTVHWVTELPRFNNPKRTKGLISWAGPILIGGKLILVSTNSHMAVLDPLDGKLVSNKELDDTAAMAPVAAEGTVLLLSDDAVLTAYK